MKKVVSLTAAVWLLVVVMAVSVFAASGVHFELSADKTTAKPADVIVCTVQVTEAVPCTQFGLKFDCDPSVFEITSGECALTDALLADFGPDRGIAALYAEATAPEGTVGSFTVKVKDTAPAGTYDIVLRSSVKNGANTVSSSINTVSVTVADGHIYSSWEKVDDKTHQRKCTDCGEVQKAEHSWDMSTLTQAPGCESAGVQTAKCGACGATKTEAVNAIGHSYDPVWQFDAENHWQICLRCRQKAATQPHTLQNGACSLCGFGGDTAEHTHTFSQEWAFDSEKHWHICACGVKQEEAPHSLDDSGICTVCGAAGVVEQLPTQQTQPTDQAPADTVEAFPWGGVFAVLVAVLIVGGSLAFLIYKKKQ